MLRLERVKAAGCSVTSAAIQRTALPGKLDCTWKNVTGQNNASLSLIFFKKKKKMTDIYHEQQATNNTLIFSRSNAHDQYIRINDRPQ